MSSSFFDLLPRGWTIILIPALGYVTLVLYRLLFHPLRKYPGPLPAKISGWPNWSNACSGNRHLELYSMHKKYGPIVRFGPDNISIDTATGLQDIYGSRKANVVKGDWYRTVMHSEQKNPSTFTAIDRSVHAYKRRMLSNAFSATALKDMEICVLQNITKWCRHLGSDPKADGWTDSVNMSTWSNYLTFDTLSDLCYGQSFNLMDKNDNRYIAELLPVAVRAVYELGYHPWVAFLRRIFFNNPVGDFLGGQMVRDNQRFHTFSRQVLAERRELQSRLEKSGDTGSARKDFFHHLDKEKDPETGQGYSVKELQAESSLLIVAGADTSSTTLAASCFYLVRYPSVLAKLRNEICSTFTSLQDIRYTESELPHLPYLRAFIDEVLRQCPPVAAHMPRKVLSEGAVIDGALYPAGTTVGVSVYALHHNEEYFPEPFRFSPERWIIDEATGVTAESVVTAQSAFCPFSIGTRGCVGKNLAYMELSLALARMVWMYDFKEGSKTEIENFRTGGGWTEEMQQEFPIKDFFVAQKNGPMLQFKARKT